MSLDVPTVRKETQGTNGTKQFRRSPFQSVNYEMIQVFRKRPINVTKFYSLVYTQVKRKNIFAQKLLNKYSQYVSLNILK